MVGYAKRAIKCDLRGEQLRTLSSGRPELDTLAMKATATEQDWGVRKCAFKKITLAAVESGRGIWEAERWAHLSEADDHREAIKA